MVSPALLGQAPNITATKSDGTLAATKKNPGDTVTYTSVISNTGSANATGVTFADPDVNGSAVQQSTLKVSPIAMNDTYTGTILSGVAINTATSTNFSATANDYVGVYNGAAGVLTIVAFDAVSAQGGTVSMTTSGANIGKFTYTSAGGFTGSDSFTYTISNTGFTATATVNLTVSGPRVWYVSESTGDDTTGKGTLASPYKTLTKVATVDAAGDRIFVFSGAYTAGMFLEANEQIYGQGVVGTNFDTVVAGTTAGSDSAARPSINGTKPTITASAGDVITLTGGNTIRGVTINSTVAGYAVLCGGNSSLQIGSSGGSTASDTTINSSGASSGCVSLSGGSGVVNILALLSNTAAAGRSVSITGRTSGAIAIIGKVSDTGAGIFLSANTGTTFNFRCLNLATGANTAFRATTGGTVNITAGDSDGIDNDGDGAVDEADEANTINNTGGGMGIQISNVTIGASNVTFRSVTSTGGTNPGIIMDTTGSSGAFIVTGDGGGSNNGSGGSITNKTGTILATGTPGIIANSTTNLRLGYLNISGCNHSGVYGTTVNGLVLTRCNITGNGDQLVSSPDETGVDITNLSGTAIGGANPTSINNCTIQNNKEVELQIKNTTGTLTDFQVNNCTISSNNADTVNPHGNLFNFIGSGTAVMTTNLAGSTFTGNAKTPGGTTGTGVNCTVSGTATMTANVSTCTLSDNNTGVEVSAAGDSTLTFDVHDNPSIAINRSHGLSCVIASDATGLINGKFRNNVVGTLGTAGSGSDLGYGIRIENQSGSTTNPANLSITGNIVQETANLTSLNVNVGLATIAATKTTNLTITGNAFKNSGGRGITIQQINTTNTTSAGTIHANVASNTFTGIVGQAGDGTEIRLRQLAANGGVFKVTQTDVNNLASVNGLTLADLSIAGTITYNQGTAPTPPLLFAPGGVEKAQMPVAIAQSVVSEPAKASPQPPAEIQVQAAAAREVGLLTQEQLTSLVAAARQRWTASGLTADQEALLDTLTFEVANLDGLRLGEADGRHIRVDADAGGNGWFVEAGDTHFDLVSSPTRLYTRPTAAPAGRLDLLTAILHEMGHALGLEDSYLQQDRDSLMYGFLTTGERRLPAMNQALGAVPHEHDGAPHFLTGTINIGTLPPGKSVTITYDVIVNNPATTTSLSSQGTVSGSNFSNVLTDDLVTGGDPLLPGAADPTVTLIDLPDVTVAVSGSPVAEDSGSAMTYTFTRQGATTAAMTVSFSTTGSTAMSGTDFTVASGTGTVAYNTGTGLGTITIPFGSSTATLTVTPTADAAVESNETVVANVATGTGYDVGTPGSATGTINNDDTAVSIDALPDTTLFEDQTVIFSYTFRRTGVTTGSQTVNFSVGGSAVYATDYTVGGGSSTFTSTNGTVIFNPGDTTKTITLDPTADNAVEGSETITLTVTAGTGYSVGSPASQTATIVDDDVNVSVSSVTPASVSEDSGTGMVYTLTRGGGSTANALPVNVQVSGTAGRTGDYSRSGFTAFDTSTGAATITFSGGSATKTVTITPTADTTAESDETVILTVADNGTPALTGGYAVGSPNSATGTILTDETPTVTNVNPATGPTVGGTSVTITGTNFTGATGVTFGGTAATSVSVTNATTITCTTPAHAAGAISVLVSTAAGANTTNSLFTYTDPINATVTGDTAPGTDGATAIGRYNLLNPSGSLTLDGSYVFAGSLIVEAGPPAVTANDAQGIWAKTSTTDTFRLLARSGSIAPGAGNALFDSFTGDPFLTSDDDVTFQGTLRVGTGSPAVTASNNTGIWTTIGVLGADPQPALAARAGSALRPPSNAVLTRFGSTGVAASGGSRIMTFNGLQADGKSGLYVMTMSTAGLPQTAVNTAVQGSTAPGAGGELWDSFVASSQEPSRMDPSGSYAWAGRLSSGKTGVFFAPLTSGIATKVAITGDAAPGTTTTFQSVDSVVIGSAISTTSSTVAFHGTLAATGDNASGLRDEGIWRGTADAPTTTLANFTLILRRGDSGIAGLTGSDKVGRISGGWLTAATGDRGAWLGELDAGGDGTSIPAPGDVQAIYSDLSGTMKLAVKQGDVAPGMPGATFATLDVPAVGGTQQMAFIGTAEGGGRTAGNNKGVWRSANNGGALTLVLHTGSPLATAQGTKIISDISFSNGGPVRSTPTQRVMDSTGRLLVRVSFTDGGSGEAFVGATDDASSGAITVINPSTSTGSKGTPFSQTFTQSGGTAPIVYTTASYLPQGLSLATNGTLSGTPTQSGTFNINVAATDATGATGLGSTYTLVINSATASEIDVRGNSTSITSGDTTPSSADNTDFGSTAVAGGTVVRTFTIANTGSAALQLTGTPRVVIGGTDAADFTVTLVPSSPIAASGNTTFQITFDPSAGGVRTAAVTIANDDGNEYSYTFAIQGTGTLPTGPEIALYRSAGSYRVDGGTFWQDNPAVVSGVEEAALLFGGSANEYSTSTSATTVSQTAWHSVLGTSGGVERADDYKLGTTYNTGVAGTSSSAYVSDNATGAAYTNYAWRLVTSQAFATTATGSTSATQTFAIKNQGTSALTITSATLTGANPGDFVLNTSGMLTSIPSGTTTLLTVAFSPTQFGSRAATLRIVNNDADEATTDIALSGTGVGPEIDVLGNATSIVSGDTTPATADHTDFGSTPVAGGTIVRTFTIANPGTVALNLTGTPKVSVNGTNAADFTVTSQPSSPVNTGGGSTTFQVTFDPSAGGLRTATLSIVNDDTDENPYTFSIQGTGIPQPAITSISPAAGPTGGSTTVTITGTGFAGTTGAAGVKFGATNATGYTVNSDTQITATAPAGTGAVDITVANPGGTSPTSTADQYTYVAAPTVTAISPIAGPTGGSAIVTITGTGFLAAPSTGAVKFGAATATYTINSNTQITASSPANSAGTYDVTVTTPGGTSATSAADQYTYVAAPTVTGVSPSAGPTAGGTMVIITGTNLSSTTGAGGVKFGAVNATTYAVNSNTQITATSPANSAGTYDVTVTTPGGTSATSAADQYTYVAPPAITGISPTAGPAAGGTLVTITGTNFSGTGAVTFGGVAAQGYTVVSTTTITATSPAGTGVVDIRVTTVGGTSATSAADQFTYIPAPTVTSVSPTAGPTSGSTQVTVTGTNFTGVTAVTFGGVATSFVFNGPTSITATSPAGSGTVDIRVTTPGGTSATSAADQFTYVPAPTVTSISPAAGPTAGGTSVIITGTNLSGATAVTFGGNAATGVVVNSGTQITATSPAGTGTVDVRVTTVGGTSATSAADQFTYVIAPVAVADGGGSVYTTAVNQQFGRGAAGGVLPNDTLRGATITSYGASTGSEQTAIGTATPTAQGGSVILNAAGGFTFTPKANFSGNDTFKYTLTNAGGASTATVTIYVDVLPTVTSTVPANSATGISLSTPITLNFSEAISTFNTFTVTDTTASASVSFTQSPTDGNASSTFTLTPTAALAAGHTFTVTVLRFQTADVDGGLSMAADYVFSFTTLPPPSTVNDPDAQGGRYQVNAGVMFDSALLTTPSSILDNDTAIGSPTLTYGPTGPASSTAANGTSTITTSNGATVLLRVNGTFTYTPAAGYSGNDNFFYNLTNASGSSRAQVLFKVNAVPPTITSISPTSGPTAGGTSVTITGTGFTGTTGTAGVTFGANNATTYTVNSNTQITATAPAGTGTVDVRVTSPGGTSVTSAADQFTYVEAPTITNISPASGPLAGGTTVTITGTNLSGAASVIFGGNPAAYLVVNSTTITATSPPGSGTVDIRVTTIGGTSAISAADQFTYAVVPTVTGVSPTAGPLAGGTSVTITGANFTGATAVTFGGTAASGFTFVNSTTITATSPAGTGTVDVRVTTPGGTSATSAADQFNYVPAPAVTSISPTAGPTTSGTSVIITGTNFSGATAVTFGGNAATGVVVNSGTQITAISPAGTGTVDVRVTTAGGTSATSAADQFTYVPAPTVTGLSPATGPQTGGTLVTITGTNFSGATAVTFGGVAATGYTVVSPTSITVPSPAGTGTVDVRVTTVGGTSATSASDQFTYVPAPTVTGLSPATGPQTGGTSVTITGTNFSGATAVTFGGVAATGYTVVSPTSITVPSPAGTGTVDVRVTTVGGTSATSAADQFTYVPAPTVTSISPTAGPTAGGTSVIITGTNFSGATAVTFGGNAATGVVVNSGTQITAISPAGTGTVDVRVTTAGGTSATSAADQFTYVPAPTVTGLSPATGPQTGGTLVTITGTNFSGATAVTFGGVAATGYTVVSPTSITVPSPAGTGTVDVRVTTVGGTSATSAADQFTYVARPTVTSISPTSGPTGGNTTVTITGTGFAVADATGAVKFGAATATYTINSNTQITATSPANAAGTYDITVTTAGGSSATSAADQFTYVAAPTITGISPAAGPLGGGTSVVITGTGFAVANTTGAVKFGGATATYTINSNTQITATSPANSAGTYDITVTTVGGTSATTTADQFTYVPAPTITSISPTAGPLGGGTSVVIIGTGFAVADATGAVKFGGTTATYTINSNTQITATSPANSAGTYDITVTTAGGTSATSAADQFTYVPAPTITSISPTAGSPAGGTTVVITGTNFAGANAVTFGATAALTFTVDSSTQITAVSPAAAPGTVDVRVTTVGGTSATSAADRYTYLSADLAITITDGVTTAIPGGSVSYTITVSNAGPDAVPNATVADTFPAILTATWTGLGAGGATATASGSGNINDTVNLPVGGSVTYTVSATISPSATGTLSNTATVSVPANIGDPDPANNSATDTDTLTPQADLAITKTDGVTTAIPGSSVTYTITASNAGLSNAPGATVADTLPASLTNVHWASVGAGGGTATASGSGSINDTVNLPAGGSVTYTVTATILPTASGLLSNTATVAAPAGVSDPTPGNNSATDTDTLANVVSIAATDASADENSGGSGTWRVTRNSTAGDLVVQLFIGTSSTASGADWTQTGADFTSLAPGGTGTITIPDGSISADVTLTPVDDIAAESAETVVMAIGLGDGYSVILPSNATVTIEANDFVVTNTGDHGEGSLRQAIQNANDIGEDSTVVFAEGVAGFIALTSGQIEITNAMTVQGPGADVVSVSGSGASRVFDINGDVTLSGLTIRDGKTTSLGGAGIHIGSGTVKVNACAIINNDASAPIQSGGGIFNESGTLTVRDSTIANNSASESGGGVQTGTNNPTQDTVTFLNSTIVDNVAGNPGSGGGISTTYDAVYLTNCTVVGNTASFGGNLAIDGGTMTLGNTIVAGGILAGEPAGSRDISGNPTSLDYNLIEDITGIFISGATAHNITGVSASLKPLAYNGGPTLTMVPQAGSPVINAGSNALASEANLTTDQRGLPRIDGVSTDIGAVEQDVTAPEITVPSDITMEATGHLTPVSFTVSATDSLDGPVTATADPASDTGFPVGDTTVTVTATDNSGNIATSTFHVVIEDTVPPVLTPHDDVIVTATNLTTLVTFDLPTATDLTQTSVTASPASGFAFPVGTTPITVTATDEGGNTDTVTFNVIVRLERPLNTTVAVTGQPVIGATGGPGNPPADALWTTFGQPAVDDTGRLAFTGAYSSVTGGKGTGLFTSQACLALVGGPAPGGAGTFKAFSEPVIDDGLAASIVTLNGVPKGTTSAIFTARGQSNDALPENGGHFPPAGAFIARAGDVATVDGATFKSFKSVEVRDGYIGFTATLNLKTGSPATTAVNDTGIWVSTGAGTPILMLREGQEVEGRKVKSFIALDSSAGSRGQGRGWLVVLGDTPRVQARVVFSDGKLAALNIDLVAGVPQITTLIQSNTVFSGGFLMTGGFGLPAANLLGEHALFGTLSSDRGPAPSVFATQNGVDYDLLAYRTQQALTNGAKFSKLKDPVLAADGGIAFAATLAGGGVKGAAVNTLWWQAPGGELTLLAQGGLAAGGAPTDLPPGAQFSSFTSLAVAANRGPIFTATLVPGKGGIAKAASNAVFALDGDGKIRRLFGVTDPIDVGGGTMKLLKSYSLLTPTVGNTGVTRSFNNAQQITWRASFDAKTQALITTLVP